MSKVSTYLNFATETEAAFNFYRTVFGGSFTGGIKRFGEIPPMDGMPPLAEADKNLVMHVELAILGGHTLMGTDAPASMGFTVNYGNNLHISLHTDSKEETDQLFAALSADGKITMPLQDMFWGDYFGSCVDKFGVQWMFSFTKNS